MDLWAACGDRIAPSPLGGNLLRIVENQEQVATSALVDDLGEQALLEDLLERTKPQLRAGTERLHTLLAAPFRYPPYATARVLAPGWSRASCTAPNT